MVFIKRIRKGGRTYLIEVESYRDGGKVKHRYLRYVGREVDGRTVLSSSVSNVEVESVKVYGQLIVLHNLAKSINLSELLGEYGDEILSLVFAHCVEPKSLNQMTDWFEKTDLNFLLDLDELTEARLLDALDSLEKQDLEVLQKKIFEAVKQKYELDISSVFYDVTNTYFYGKKCAWGKKGKSKEGQKDQPLVQIGLAVARKEGIPLFHKTFEGNIHDSRTLQAVIPYFKSFNIRDVILVYDRGIPSKENFIDAERLGWDTLCGLAANTALKKEIRRMREKKEFVNVQNRIPLSNTAMYGISKKYQIGITKGKLVVCFNNRQKTLIQESRYDEIQTAQTRLAENKNIKSGLQKYFDKKGNIKSFEIKKAEEFDGFSCIFSTKQISTEEVVKVYFEKELVEKAFKNLKGVTGLRPIRHWLYNRVEAHIFICYLSYLLLSLLQYKLKKIKVGAVEALKELSSLYKIYMKDTEKNFVLTKLVKLNKKQEKILRAVDKKLLQV